MQKGIHWLDILTRKEQVLFLKNYAAQNSTSNISDYLNREHDSFFRFIDSGFKWDFTDEGYEWWVNVAFKQNDQL